MAAPQVLRARRAIERRIGKYVIEPANAFGGSKLAYAQTLCADAMPTAITTRTLWETDDNKMKREKIADHQASKTRLCERIKATIASSKNAHIEQFSVPIPVQEPILSNDERGVAYGNLGTALLTLGERESGTTRLEQAVIAFDACLTVASKAWPEEWVQDVRSNRDEAMAEIARRSVR
jgi:hypothetical protein